MSTFKCCAQFAVVMYTCMLILMAIAPFQVADRVHARANIWINFAIVLAMDQVKNITCQPLIWWAVILRCGTIAPGIQEYNSDYIQNWEQMDSLMTQIRLTIKGFLDRHTVRLCSILLVCVYAAFVVFWIVIAP